MKEGAARAEGEGDEVGSGEGDRRPEARGIGGEEGGHEGSLLGG